jgi:hypothetical protein
MGWLTSTSSFHFFQRPILHMDRSAFFAWYTPPITGCLPLDANRDEQAGDGMTGRMTGDCTN